MTNTSFSGQASTKMFFGVNVRPSENVHFSTVSHLGLNSSHLETSWLPGSDLGLSLPIHLAFIMTNNNNNRNNELVVTQL